MSEPIDRNNTLTEVRVSVPTEHLDLVIDYITEEICAGIVLEDETGDGLAPILFYAPPSEAEMQTAMLRAFLTRLGSGQERCAVSTRTINNEEWEESYRRSVRPISLPPDILVRPPWVNPQSDLRYDIVIEPKMAFGTGTHETTRSCLRVIRDRLQPGMRFLDLGCGSGILSILAGMMGASYIKAIDYDLLAVDNSVENFDRNGVTTPNDIVLGSIENCDKDSPYDFVCANIIKSAILDMIDRIVAATAIPGTLVLSGLLEQDIDDIRTALNRIGIDRFETIVDNEWRTLIIVRT